MSGCPEIEYCSPTVHLTLSHPFEPLLEGAAELLAAFYPATKAK